MHVYINDPTQPKPYESMELTQKAGVNICLKFGNDGFRLILRRNRAQTRGDIDELRAGAPAI